MIERGRERERERERNTNLYQRLTMNKGICVLRVVTE